MGFCFFTRSVFCLTDRSLESIFKIRAFFPGVHILSLHVWNGSSTCWNVLMEAFTREVLMMLKSV